MVEIVCPVCATLDPPCVEITELILVCRCGECGTTFTIQLNERRETPVRRRGPPRDRGGSDSSPSS